MKNYKRKLELIIGGLILLAGWVRAEEKASAAMTALSSTTISGFAVAAADVVAANTSHRTWIVDDDGADCPGAAFQSIQAAVDAASPGDTIQVCPGIYPERVRVEKTLRLLGPKHGKDARKRTLQSSGEAVVASPTPFFLNADDIVLDGFTIKVVLDDSGEGSGILTGNLFSGYQILNNVGDAGGVTILFPGCSGRKQSIAWQNHFFNRLGIATSDDEPFVAAHNLVIEANLFTDSSLLLASGADTNVLILKNKLQGEVHARAGLAIFNAQAVTVEENKLLGLEGDALYVQASSNVVVKENILRDGAGAAIWLDSIPGGLEVDGNHVAGFAATALVLMNSSGVLILENEVEDSNAGLQLFSSVANRVLSNEIKDHVTIGIDASADSSGNRFQSNQVDGNNILDCRDASTGSSTAGTANVWKNNECNHSLPETICQ